MSPFLLSGGEQRLGPPVAVCTTMETGLCHGMVSQAHPISSSNSAVLLLQVGDKLNVRLWETREISEL